MMLSTQTPLAVRLGRFTMKTDSEGGKWGTATMVLKVDDVDGLKAPLKDGYKLMTNTAYEELTADEKMPNVSLEFQNGAAHGTKRTFQPKELFAFKFKRESSTQAGTLKKDRGTGVELEFKFTNPLIECGAWALDNYGDTLTMTIFTVQGELPITPAEPPSGDSQEARNARIVEEEQKDAAVPVRAKRGRPKKAA